MTLYIHLVRLTDEGVKEIGRLKEILAANRRVIEGNGGRVVRAWSTLGRYDLVAVLEAPDDATAMKISAAVAEGGIFRPESLVAVPLEEFESAVSA
jgi:uncharacterized protein with GYD domain